MFPISVYSVNILTLVFVKVLDKLQMLPDDNKMLI